MRKTARAIGLFAIGLALSMVVQSTHGCELKKHSSGEDVMLSKMITNAQSKTGTKRSPARYLLDRGCLVLDVETTGVRSEARVWDICVLEINRDATSELVNQVYDPGLDAKSWEKRAYEMAQSSLESPFPELTLAETADKFTLARGDELVEMLEGRAVLYWASGAYDERMIRQEVARIGFSRYSQAWQRIQWHDAMGMYVKFREARSRPLKDKNGKLKHCCSLEQACLDERIEPEPTHLARSGAIRVAELLRVMSI